LVGSEFLDYGPPIGARIKHYIGNFLDHHFARKADSVIAVTDSIKAEFLKRDDQPADQIYVIPNGIEEDFIQRAAQAESDIVESIKAESIKAESSKNELKSDESNVDESTQIELEAAESNVTASLDEGQAEIQSATQSVMQNTAPVFMFAGNMAAYQGIDLMLKAFALVVKTLPDAKLKILSHEPFSSYQALADSLGLSENLSLEDIKLNELPAMLVHADVLLNPRTRCTVIPQKLLNYIAAGRPVVSFSGSAKIVTDRVDGLIVENGNVQAFAAAMLELVNNPVLGKTLAAAGLRSMQVRYSWRSAARKTLTVYSDTLSKYAEK
jgi:glycosyltransferase involved in cell wall biosynthesis